MEIHADLVVACDGRHSSLRDAAGLKPIEVGVGVDVLWFQLPRQENDPEQVLGLINYGKMMILINRGDYYQAGLLIAKGSFEGIRNRGLDAFQQMILDVAPFLSDRVRDLRSWDQVKLLTIQINRLKQWWRPGLLMIGDAAHAMSPAFGVGINLAIADAVAAANYLGPRWKPNTVTLRRIQFRREWPVRIVQFVQAVVHRVMVHFLFRQRGPAKAPAVLKLIAAQPQTRALAARFVGLGVLPELPRRRKPVPVIAAVLFGRLAGLAVRFVSRGSSSAKSWEAWVKKYFDKKAAGEKNIELVPEKLD